MIETTRRQNRCIETATACQLEQLADFDTLQRKLDRTQEIALHSLLTRQEIALLGSTEPDAQESPYIPLGIQRQLLPSGQVMEYRAALRAIPIPPTGLYLFGMRPNNMRERPLVSLELLDRGTHETVNDPRLLFPELYQPCSRERNRTAEFPYRRMQVEIKI